MELEFDQRASTYDQSRMHRELSARVAGFIDLSHVDTVLDVATGTGLLLRALPRRVTAFGVDVSRAMVEVARSHLPLATIVQGDAASLPFADELFDLVTCVSALPYIDVPTAAREWRRVLADSGRVIVTVWAVDGIASTRMLREASSEVGISVMDPNAPYGSQAGLAQLASLLTMRIGRVEEWTHPSAPIDPAAMVTRRSSIGPQYDLSRSSQDERRQVSERLSALVSEQRGLLDRCFIAEFV